MKWIVKSLVVGELLGFLVGMNTPINLCEMPEPLVRARNWSSNARKYNDENLLVIKDSSIASSYENKFLTISGESI